LDETVSCVPDLVRRQRSLSWQTEEVITVSVARAALRESRGLGPNDSGVVELIASNCLGGKRGPF
jgi:hypothetical protein